MPACAQVTNSNAVSHCAARAAAVRWMGVIDRFLSTRVQLDAAVLGPGGLVAALHRGALLAETHGFDLSVGRPEQCQRLGHRFSPLLAQREVVLAAAAL